MRYLNNPSNIRYNRLNKWKGLLGVDNGFCTFESLDYGLRALVVLLRGYIKRGFDTPEKIISRFAPSSENDTDIYLRFVCQFLHIESDTKIKYNSNLFYFLCVAICKFETNTIIGGLDIVLIIKTFKL